MIRSQGRPLDPATRAFLEPRFGRDFSGVRVHSDGRAAESARAIAALAYVVGQHVVFAENRYAPSTDAGAWLLAHELTHTLQQRQTGDGPGVVPRHPTSLGAYPAAERRRLLVSGENPASIDAAFLQGAFGPAPPGSHGTSAFSFTGTVLFDPSIPAALLAGLRSTGSSMIGAALPLGFTISLALDLTPFGGPNGCFRFTHFDHTERGTTTTILLIESVGAAPTMPTVSVPHLPNTFTVRGQTFTVNSGWNDQQFGLVQATLNRLPDAVIREATGITFSLNGQGTLEEAEHYIAERDEIELHLNAFPTSLATMMGAPIGMQKITHELGHLLDLHRLERAWRTFDAGGQTPAGRAALFAQRSLSGSRWGLGASGSFAQNDARTSTAGPRFRQDAVLDGISPGSTATDPLTGSPTTYSNTNWEEFFADSFMIYVNDPELLRLLRPHLYGFFASRFPLPRPPERTPPAGRIGGSPPPRRR